MLCFPAALRDRNEGVLAKTAVTFLACRLSLRRTISSSEAVTCCISTAWEALAASCTRVGAPTQRPSGENLSNTLRAGGDEDVVEQTRPGIKSSPSLQGRPCQSQPDKRRGGVEKREQLKAAVQTSDRERCVVVTVDDEARVHAGHGV